MIVLRDKKNPETLEPYPTLKAVCRAYRKFSYHYLKRKKFPFDYKGYRFDKINTKR